VISSLSIIDYDENYAHLDYYVVAPEHRKKGYGLKLFQNVMNRFKNHSIVLNAVEK
jgi:hypothetical protein